MKPRCSTDPESRLIHGDCIIDRIHRSALPPHFHQSALEMPAVLGALLACTLLFAACTTIPASTPAVEGKPNNVILFLGDGMGISTVTAARIFAGQRLGGTGEEHELPFETFPHVALIKTYNTDAQVPDSSGTMSAIMTGEKTRAGHISVGANVAPGDCIAARQNEVRTLLEEAEDRGLATGVISTARITHATPASAYAHMPNRDWEHDAMLPQEAREQGCRDIAQQLVEFAPGDGIDVTLGGGRASFLPTGVADQEYAEQSGLRADGRNLIEEWRNGAAGRHFVWDHAGFETLPPDGQVLGLFEPSHMRFEAERPADGAGEPSLAELTAFAIKRLQRSATGYFLVIEGGRIDHAHHVGNAYNALNDTLALADAVQAAMELANAENTLILVTADHSHSFMITGYPRRGNPILGKVEIAPGELATDAAGRPYTTLSYANGPGYLPDPPDLTTTDTTAPTYQQYAGLPMDYETHGGEDVAAYARGPNAAAVHGVLEQNLLHTVMRGALFGPQQ